MFRLAMPILALALVGPLAAMAQEETEKKGPDALHPRVKLEITQGEGETPLGDIILELDAEKAPVTVDNFLQYAEDGYYNDTIFHRVISTFMIQGGGYTSAMDEKSEGLRAPIKNEWQNGWKNTRGTIAMARKGWRPGMPLEMKVEMANSATSQFFINVVDNPRLDQPQADQAAYCVFGKVVEGMDVVDKIRDTELVKHPKYSSRSAVTPKEPVVIKSVTLLDGLKYAQVAAVTKPAVEAAAKEAAERAKAVALAKAEETKQAQALAKSFEELLAKGEDEQGNKLRTTDSGLKYVILKEGQGSAPQPTDTVVVQYTGWLLNGTKFDSSVDRGTPATFPLNRVIKGWTEGVGLMKVGAKHRLVIPPDLAYGSKGRPSIPPSSTLVFDVELLAVK